MEEVCFIKNYEEKKWNNLKKHRTKNIYLLYNNIMVE